jgi:hypothetical protein
MTGLNHSSEVAQLGYDWPLVRYTMIQLTKDQHDELAANDKETAKVVDPVTNTEYVLIRADVFAHIGGMVDADFHISEAYPAMSRAFAELWNDPDMDDYDRYEEIKR